MSEQAIVGYWVFICCFSGGSGGGSIQTWRLDPKSGSLTFIAETTVGVSSPLFARADASGSFLYVADFVKECEGQPGGAICAYSIDRQTGTLTYLNRQNAGGSVPCYITVGPGTQGGRHALVANYGSGSVSSLPIGADGRLAPACDVRQHAGADAKLKPKAHSIVTDPAGRFALAADLGVDRVFVYRLDSGTGALTPHNPPFVQSKAGSGPRHLAFHPRLNMLYAMTEVDNTVIAMRYDPASGSAEIVQVMATLPEGFEGKNHGADIHVHPNGKFIYASNRGHDALATFAIDQNDGKLSFVAHQPTLGKFPRSFAIEPAGGLMVVGNEHSGEVRVFRINADSGLIAPVGEAHQMKGPACVALVPCG